MDTRKTEQSDPKNVVDYRTLPSIEFLLTLLRRHIWVFAVVAVCVAPFALLAISSAPKTYHSSVVITYNAGEVLDPSLEVISPNSQFASAVERVQNTLRDESFLNQLVLAVLDDEIANSPDKLRFFPEFVKKFLKSFETVSESLVAQPLPDEPQARAERLRAEALAVQNRISISANFDLVNANTMVLIAEGATAFQASNLAKVASELLLTRFYEQELARVERALGSVEKFYSSQPVEEIKRESKTTQLGRGGMGAMRVSRVSRAEALSLQKRETEILQQIADAEAEVQTERAALAALEQKIKSLSERYGPSHPTIVQAKAELERGRGSRNFSGARSRIRTLQRELLEVQSEIGDLGETDKLQSVEDTLTRTSIRLDRYRLAAAQLRQQVAEPESRTILVPASLPSRPLKHSSSRTMKVAAFSAVLVGALSVVIALLRELLNPRARDPWRIIFQFNIPLLARFKYRQVERRRRKNFIGDDFEQEPDLSGSGNSFGYREIEVFLAEVGDARVIHFVQPEDSRELHRTLSGFIRFFSADKTESSLVVDCSSVPSEIADGGEPSFSRQSRGGLRRLLQGESDYDAVCQRPEQYPGLEYVWLGARSERERASLLSSKQFKDFMAKQREQHRFCFLIGVGPSDPLCQRLLAECADHSIVIVDGNETTYSEIGCLRETIPARKFSGFIFLGA